MKKRLNIESVANELKGNSAFFPDYQKDDTSQKPESHTSSPAELLPEPLSQTAANTDKGSAPKILGSKPKQYTTHSQYQEPVPLKEEISETQDNRYIPERANVPTPARPNGKRIITRNS